MQPFLPLLMRALYSVMAIGSVCAGSTTVLAADPVRTSVADRGLAASKASDGEPAGGGKWTMEYQIDRFQLHFDFQLEQPQQLADELRQFEAELREMLPGTVHASPVHMVIFFHAEEYQRYMRHYFPKAPFRRAMFIQDRGPGLLFTHWHSEVMTDVRHEVTHALLNRTASPLPLWMDEGLAEYFEDPSAQRFDGSPHLQQLAVRTAHGWQPMPLVELEQIKRLDQFTDEHYFAAWSWMHFLLHRSPETRQLVIAQLQRYAGGEAPPPLSRLLREIMPDFAEQYRYHFANK